MSSRKLILGIAAVVGVAAGVTVIVSYRAAPASDGPLDGGRQGSEAGRSRAAAAPISEAVLAEAVRGAAGSMAELGLSEPDIRSASAGLAALLGVLAEGDADGYLEYYEALGGALSSRAEVIADLRFKSRGHPGFDEESWSLLDPRSKFREIIGRPRELNAAVVAIEPAPETMGFGLTPPLPVNHHIQGMRSAINPPTPSLFQYGSDAEWMWMEYGVEISGGIDAVLRIELLFDPAVGAWLPQRAGLIAPSDQDLPGIVF